MAEQGIRLLPEAQYGPRRSASTPKPKSRSGARSRPRRRSRSTERIRVVDMARRIEQEDLTDSVAEALQFISHHHPPDFVRALRRAYDAETSAPAKAAIEQLLINSRLAAFGRRPICQDTGVVQVFLRVGAGAAVEPPRRRGAAAACSRCSTMPCGAPMAIRRTRCAPRWSRDPLGAAPEHARQHAGDRASRDRRRRRARGAGRSQRRRRRRQGALRDAQPERQCRRLGARAAARHGRGLVPAGRPRRRHRRQPRAGDAAGEAVAVRADRHRRAAPRGPAMPKTRCGSNCTSASTRSASAHKASAGSARCSTSRWRRPRVTLRRFRSRSCPTAPRRAGCASPGRLRARHRSSRHRRQLWDGIADRFDAPGAIKVDLDRLDRAQVAAWRIGQTLLLSGRVLTARDAAHKRLVDLLERGRRCRSISRGRVVYYVGPVDAVAGEAVGPAGPTTATRMDKFVEHAAGPDRAAGDDRQGRARPAMRSASIRRHAAAYLAATGGAAYLLSKAIRSARVVAFEDLGMEAIHEFELKTSR